METERPVTTRGTSPAGFVPRLNHAARTPEQDVLPLTAFERFLLMCDRPENPMVIRVSMRIFGALDAEKLAQAFRTTVARHPLFSAVIREHRGTTAWIPCDEPHQVVLRETGTLIDQVPESHEIPPIDPSREPGVRVEVLCTPDGGLIVLDAHHSAADGGALRQFITDWLHCYDRATADAAPSWPELELEKLARRAVLRAAGMRQPVSFRDAVRNFIVTVRGRTARLPHRAQEVRSTGSDAGHSATHRYSPEQTQDLRQSLKAMGVTLNDLFVAACITAFARQFPSIPATRYISLLNPVDLRMPSDRLLPAANRFGVAILRRQVIDCGSIADILPGVRDEMTYVKRDYVGAEFVRGLSSADRIPGMVRFLHRIGLFSPTLQFTCLGDVTRFPKSLITYIDGKPLPGGVCLDSVAGYAPVPPNVPICIAACETRGRLVLTARSADRYMAEGETQAFLKALVELVEAVIISPIQPGMES